MKGKLKALAGAALRRGQRRLLGGHGAVLMFHSVPADDTLARRVIPAPTMEMSAADLGRHLDQQQRDGCDLLSLDELAERLQRRQPGPRRFACLTFDDGYLDNLTQALPVLRARQAPLTIFLIPGLIDQTLVHYGAILQDWVRDSERLRFTVQGQAHSLEARSEPQKVQALRQLQQTLGQALQARDYRGFFEDHGVPFQNHALSWEQILEMDQDPLVTFGAHTLHHPRLTQVDTQTVQDEILGSKRRLEEVLGHPVEHFAYPFGDHGPRESVLARQMGFRTISTTRQGYTDLRRSDPLSLPRLRATAFS